MIHRFPVLYAVLFAYSLCRRLPLVELLIRYLASVTSNVWASALLDQQYRGSRSQVVYAVLSRACCSGGRYFRNFQSCKWKCKSDLGQRVRGWGGTGYRLIVLRHLAAAATSHLRVS